MRDVEDWGGTFYYAGDGVEPTKIKRKAKRLARAVAVETAAEIEHDDMETMTKVIKIS